ncbi:GIY-YIG nuclease superfamily protein [bacterium BMS3Abin09]|nr:GIY-YIG nuclease superfamily protein [bacterium BMS3Abin09]GBE40997.1 GIY-YIG nuclease superfamily protein [bacterium BMS3Bbin09]
MRKIKRTGSFSVYIVRCSKGTFYTGYTTDLDNRIKKHNDGTGAKYLRGKGPIKLVYAREYRYFKNAVKAEIEIKKLKRKQKEELIRKHSH